MKGKVEMIADHSHCEVLGEFDTQIAIKNNDSYMIVTTLEGAEIIEKGNKVFSGLLPRYGTELIDVIYYEPQDCYFLNLSFKLFRMNIQPPYKFTPLNLQCSSKVTSSLRVCSSSERILVSKSSGHISVYDPVRNQIEFKVRMFQSIEIENFVCFGSLQCSVIGISLCGKLAVSRLSIKRRKVLAVSQYQLKMMEERSEHPNTVTICPDHQTFCVGFTGYSQELADYLNSRIQVMSLRGNQISEKYVLDQWKEEIPQLLSFDYFSVVESKMIFLALAQSDDGLIFQYGLNLEDGRLEELKEKMNVSGSENPIKLCRLGNKVYCIGLDLILRRIRFEL